MIDEYLDAILLDLENTLKNIKELGLRLTTIYIGGGTPTTLNPAQMERLLSKIDEFVDTKELLEFTLEAGRPDTITKEKLQKSASPMLRPVTIRRRAASISSPRRSTSVSPP